MDLTRTPLDDVGPSTTPTTGAAAGWAVSAHPAAAPVVGVVDGPNSHAFGRRSRNEPAPSNVDAGVTNASARRLVENEIAALEVLALPDPLVSALLGQVELLGSSTGKLLSVAVEGPSSEPRAIEACARGAAVTVGSPHGALAPVLDM